LQILGRVDEDPERLGVGPVRVVDRHQHRPVVGQRGEQPLASVVDTGRERGSRGEQGCGELGRAGQRAGTAEPRHHRSEQASHQFIWRGGRQLRGPGPEHAYAVGLGPVAGGLEQRGLADAGHTGQHEHPRGAGPDVAQTVGQGIELRRSLDDHVGSPASRVDNR
jgi:hypothetical protein